MVERSSQRQEGSQIPENASIGQLDIFGETKQSEKPIEPLAAMPATKIDEALQKFVEETKSMIGELDEEQASDLAITEEESRFIDSRPLVRKPETRSLIPPEIEAALQDSQPVLFDIEEVWQREWKGMPEFSQEDLTPCKQVIVNFATPADVKQFGELIGQDIPLGTKSSTWYPDVENDHAMARWRFVDGEPTASDLHSF